MTLRNMQISQSEKSILAPPPCQILAMPIIPPCKRAATKP